MQVEEEKNQGRQPRKKQYVNRNWKQREKLEKADPSLFQKWDREQKYLKGLVKMTDDLSFSDINDLKDLKYVGGLDISFHKKDKDIACSCYVILSFPELKVVYSDSEMVVLEGEYIPGFLAFREAAHFLKLIRKQMRYKPEISPQVILTDGNGLLHTNSFGIACHLGVLIDLPTIGVGKTVFAVDGLTRLGVKYLCQKNKKAGDAQFLVGKSGKIWGAGLKPRDNIKDPLIVSIGHRISLETALVIVRRLCVYRVPEPVRQADILSRQIVKKFKSNGKVVRNQLEFLSIKKLKPKKQHIKQDIKIDMESFEEFPELQEIKKKIKKDIQKEIKEESKSEKEKTDSESDSSSEFDKNEDPFA